jgi:hypothetical protein
MPERRLVDGARETKILFVRLSKRELDEKREQHFAALEKVLEAESTEKLRAKSEKDRIAGLAAVAEEIAAIVRVGAEPRPVSCVVTYDLTTATVITYREDYDRTAPGAIVSTRGMDLTDWGNAQPKEDPTPRRRVAPVEKVVSLGAEDPIGVADLPALTPTRTDKAGRPYTSAELGMLRTHAQLVSEGHGRVPTQEQIAAKTGLDLKPAMELVDGLGLSVALTEEERAEPPKKGKKKGKGALVDEYLVELAHKQISKLTGEAPALVDVAERAHVSPGRTAEICAAAGLALWTAPAGPHGPEVERVLASHAKRTEANHLPELAELAAHADVSLSAAAQIVAQHRLDIFGARA